MFTFLRTITLALFFLISTDAWANGISNLRVDSITETEAILRFKVYSTG